MRITDNMSVGMFLTNLESGKERVSKYSNQVSTNRKLQDIADDPIGVMQSLAARSQLTLYQRYEANAKIARNWVDTSELNLEDMNATVQDIYELVNSGANDTKNASDKKTIANQIRELARHIVDLANASVSDKFMYGGYNTYEDPFKLDLDSNPPTFKYNGIDLLSANESDPAIEKEAAQHIQIETSLEQMFDLNFNGIELFGVGGECFMKDIIDTIDLLDSGASGDVISGQIDKIQEAEDHILSLCTICGTKQNKIDTLLNRYSEDIINCEEIKSQVEDVSQGEAIMNLKIAEVVYQQALAAGSRIIQPTLADFLK